MSHTGNWSRNPRKMALETARLRATEPAGRTDAAALTPAMSIARGWSEVSIGCPTCRCTVVMRPGYPPQSLRHATWAELGRRMRHTACGSRPDVIRLARPVTGDGGAPRSVTMAQVPIRAP